MSLIREIDMNFNRVIDEATSLLVEGLKMTVLISLLSLLIGLVIGFLTCLLCTYKTKSFAECRNFGEKLVLLICLIPKGIGNLYIWVIRGTPMMIQAFIIYFGMPQVIQTLVSLSFRLSASTAGLITLSLNAGAYISEIFRGGIQAVNKGQIEAARSLGLGKARTMFRVVLPQAFKIAIPSLVNQFAITVKDTSILSVIGLAELTNKAKVYVGKSYEFFATYLVVAIYYLVFISLLMLLSKYVEKKLNYDKKRD